MTDEDGLITFFSIGIFIFFLFDNQMRMIKKRSSQIIIEDKDVDKDAEDEERGRAQTNCDN